MFKKSLLAVALVSVATLSTTVNADQPNGYLFAGIGQSDADIRVQDEKDAAWKIGAGIQLNSNIAVEFQYSDLGKISDSGVVTDGQSQLPFRFDAETTGLGANLVGSIPLDRMSLFGKLGYHQMKTKISVNTPIGSGSDSEKEWVVSYGLGAGFALTETFSVIAEYERYSDVADDYDVDLLSVGLRYNF